MTLPSANFHPRYVSKISNWHGHFGFACDLISFVRPKILVELGVHNGDSYFCFCESIHHLELSCDCYGIDNWKGDEQSGLYGDEVFEEVSSKNEKYESSSLIRLNFNDAVSKFEDNSIDILHLDGCHYYESVLKDFNNWLPKVKNNGYILFHDVCIHREGFGVAKLWNEIHNEYPSFLFPHSCGLGIIKKTKDDPSYIFNDFRPENQNYIHAYYKAVSEKSLLEYKLMELTNSLA